MLKTRFLRLQLSPPHPEVEEALRLLKGAGFRLAALTNNGQSVVDTQLENSGLAQYFEKILSADTIKVGSITSKGPVYASQGRHMSYVYWLSKIVPSCCLDRSLLHFSSSKTIFQIVGSILACLDRISQSNSAVLSEWRLDWSLLTSKRTRKPLSSRKRRPLCLRCGGSGRPQHHTESPSVFGQRSVTEPIPSSRKHRC